MNIMMRKFAMLENQMEKQEEEIKTLGYCSKPFDQDFKRKVSYLMNMVRDID